MLRDMLLPMTGTAGDEDALSFAIQLAASRNAHLTVAVPVDVPLPMPTPWGITPDPLLSEMYQRLREEASVKAERVRERLRNESIPWDVQVEDALLVEPPLAMARHARYADLCVLAAPRRAADDQALARAYFSTLLFESGRPLLVVPANAQAPDAFRRIVVAWSPTRESTRALHDALPLAAKRAAVDICIVDPLIGDADYGSEPGADIASHLARHDVDVTVTRRTSEGQSVATAVLIHAAHANAQLVVAGGYGHSRLREWILGGTTRELLAGTPLPILFAH